MKSLIFVCLSCITLSQAYTVGLLERQMGTSPNWKIARHNTFQMDIAHRFTSTLENEGDWTPVYQDFLGMDGPANIGLGFTYGLANLTEFSLTRYRYGKQYQLANRWKLLDQYVDQTPLSWSAEANTGWRIQPGLDNRLSYGYHTVLGRDWLDESLFVNLIWAGQYGISTANEDVPYDNKWTHGVAMVLGLRWDRMTLSGEYIRPLTGYLRKNSQSIITDAYGIQFAYRTYQHIFSVGVQNHYFNNFQELVAGANNSVLSNTNLRFGFNITREFDFLLQDKAKVGQRKSQR